MRQQLDTAGKNLIKSFEGLRLHAYRDIAGIWTIGYGSTYYAGGRHVREGDRLDNEVAADLLFCNTLAQYEEAVSRLVKVPLTQNQYNALVSFAYNAGIGALQNSTALRRLNASDYTGAADALLMWDKITDPKTGKKVTSDTLVKRRKAERQLFLTA